MLIINDEDDVLNILLYLVVLYGYDKVVKELIDRGVVIDVRCEIFNFFYFFL